MKEEKKIGEIKKGRRENDVNRMKERKGVDIVKGKEKKVLRSERRGEIEWRRKEEKKRRKGKGIDEMEEDGLGWEEKMD